jgi:peptide/nickel transport system substrate-binding protein
MHRKSALITLALILSITLILVPTAFSQPPNPQEYVIVTIGEPETLDPAWLYDTASAEICSHIYETLIFFNVTRDATGYPIDPATAGQTGEFVPAVATSWTVESIDENDTGDLITWVERWIYEIDLGITFHDGSSVTPQDIEYSMERWMVQDRTGGPEWMIFEPLFEMYHASHIVAAYDNVTAARLMDEAVQSNSTHVWFNFVIAYAPWSAIVAQSWAGILSYSYQIGLSSQVAGAPRVGDWPGAGVSFDNRWGPSTPGTGDYDDEWWYWHDPEVSPIDQALSDHGEPPMGCGPYEFDYWIKGVEWQVDAYMGYYQGHPSPDLPAAATGNNILNVTEKFISEWATRKMTFLAGDADTAAIPRSNIPEMILNWPQPTPATETYPGGIDCIPELPLLVASPCVFYGFNVSTTSPFLGVAGGLPYGTYDESGIAPDFLSSATIRNAFSYCINYTKYIEEVYMNEAELCTDPIIEGLPFDNPAQTAPWFPDGNVSKAKELFQSIPALWTAGFTIGMTYNTGNTARQKAAEAFKAAIEGPTMGNPKFHVDVLGVDWPTYLGHLVNGELTAFTLGWLADFPDAHNFAMPFMHEYGDFAYFQNVVYGDSGRLQINYTVNGAPFGNDNLVIDNTYVNTMIENGVKTTIPAERQVIYYELQAIYVEENIGVPLCKPTGRRWERDWINGWYYNPIYPGAYSYHLWKSFEVSPTSVDVEVTSLDLGSDNITDHLISGAWHAPKTGEPWVKYDPSTGGTAPLVLCNATITSDVSSGGAVFTYLIWYGLCPDGYGEQFDYEIVLTLLLAGSSLTIGPGNVSLAMPEEGNYTFGVYVWLITAGALNVNVAPDFQSGWFLALGEGDLNADWIVDGQDFQKVKRAVPSAPGQAKWYYYAEVNGDGIVDGQDYQVVKALIPFAYSPHI